VTLHLHHLRGCSPTPLANYLKALGILRLVAEQADPAVRGWWQDEHFCLLSSLSKEDLEKFFLEKYEPTPLLSPWNKGCGFFKAGDPGMAPLEASIAPRFARFRAGIVAGRRLLDEVSSADAVIRAIKARTKTNKSFQTDKQRLALAESSSFKSFVDQLTNAIERKEATSEEQADARRELAEVQSLVKAATKPPTKSEADRIKESVGYKRLLAIADRRFKALKATLIPDCRREWRGPHAEWLSAAVVLDEDGTPTWPSLLGTGGNDGNLDFTNNLMQRLVELFDVASQDGNARTEAPHLLVNALWSAPVNSLLNSAIGQFQPSAAGGANSTTGPAGDSLVNAWDFLLMMEGSLPFRSQLTRRFDPNEISRASAPFVVRPHAAGHASAGTEKAQRGEQWMPLWSQPSTLRDVATLLGEARIQLGRQTANRPIDVVRAISRLGVARGIDSFTRYGYLERNGQSTLAVPLGRISVRQHPQAFLIDDISGWIAQLQRCARDKNATSRLINAERRLTDAVLAALTHDPQPVLWQGVLLAAVEIEMMQATGTAIEAQPMPPLRPEWIEATFDPELAVEWRLALALGSAAAKYFKFQPTDSVRGHCLPLDNKSFWPRFRTSEKRLVRDPRVVVSGRGAISDCAAIVERRLIEASQKGERRLPLVAAPGCGAQLGDLAAFVAGNVDADRTFSLARAFMAVQWSKFEPKKHRPNTIASDDQPPEAWLALRLSCLPWPLEDGRRISAESSIVRRLMAGDTASATEIALRRLRAAGVRMPLEAATTDPERSRLWAAALVFPIHRDSAQKAAALLDPSLKGQVHA
jgi:CRISPR-associated protein Csx17